MYIKDAIEFALNEDLERTVVANKLGISRAMLSHYLNRDNTPRLDVAAKLWGEYGIVVEPFTERAVIKQWTELNNGA